MGGRPRFLGLGLFSAAHNCVELGALSCPGRGASVGVTFGESLGGGSLELDDLGLPLFRVGVCGFLAACGLGSG